MHENINYDVLFDEVESILNTPRGDFEGARQKLLDALDFENPILEPGKKQVGFSFGNIVEETLFYKRFNRDQKYEVLEYPLSKINFYIARTYVCEKDYDEARKYLKRAIKCNPFDIVSYLELSDIYKFEREYRSMYMTLVELVKYAYTPIDLSYFYFELAEYYMFMKNYNLANILYSYSSYFNETTNVETKLTQIAMELKRPLLLNSKKDCQNYLKQVNIPLGIDPKNLKALHEMYEELKDYPQEYKLREAVKKTLYNLTWDERFEERMTIKNRFFGFSFMVPESWKILDKSEFNKTSTGSYTLYVIETERQNVMNMDILKEATNNLINDYSEFRNFVIKKGFFVASESEIDAGNNIKYILMISQSKLLNEFLTMIHAVFTINGKLIDITCPTSGNYNDSNIKEIYSDLNVIRINKLISSIEII